MKIALIGAKGIPSRVSGLEIHAEKIASGLVKKGFNVTAFCRKRYCSRITSTYKGIEIFYIPSINTKHFDAISYSLFATIYALYKGYDCFWFHALGPACMAWLPKLFGKKVVSTVHGLDWKREKFGNFSKKILKFGEKSIAKCADEIIVLNNIEANYFKHTWNRECNVIANGIEQPNFRKIDLIKILYGLERKNYILFLSRLVPEKGVDCLIRAYNLLDTEKKLVIAGKGVHTSEYEKEVKLLASENDNIIFTGFVDGKQLEELYSNAYMYILPSTIEGQSIGLLEAMSYGNACIVSNIPENISVIENGGVSFRCMDEKDLMNKISYLDNNPYLADNLGELAVNLVKNNFNWDKSIEETAVVFKKLNEKAEKEEIINFEKA